MALPSKNLNILQNIDFLKIEFALTKKCWYQQSNTIRTMKIIKVCLFLIKSNSGGNPCSQVIVVSNLAQSNHNLPQIIDGLFSFCCHVAIY